MNRILGILVFLIIAVNAVGGMASTWYFHEDYSPYRIDTIESFLKDADYFQEGQDLYQINALTFDGVWAYTAIAYESNHANITKEINGDTIDLTFSTENRSNWGEWKHFDFKKDGQLYFKDIYDGPAIALSTYVYFPDNIYQNHLKLF